MAGSEEDDLAAIAWPGFVDILSAVIIMFVFFLMLVASALFFHVIIFKSEVISGEKQITTIAKLKESVKSFEAQFAESKDQEVKIDEDTKNEIVIFFGKDSISVNQVSYNIVKGFLEGFFKDKNFNDYQIKITASKDPEKIPTASRKIAVARLLNARNVVIDTFKNPNLVYPKVIDGEPINDTYDWVKITIEQ